MVLFFASGFAALVYEVVWFQQLRFTIGSSHLSVSILLASFMGGLSLGSWFYHRWVPLNVAPFRAYAALELGIAVSGVCVLLLLPLLSKVYFSIVGHGITNVALRAGLSALLLLPPTMLMGATLPAISRWVDFQKAASARIGFLYAANTLGAVAGAIIAGFFLLRHFNIYVATSVAVIVNMSIAIASQGMSSRHCDQLAKDPDINVVPAATRHVAISIVLLLSGFSALGAQVIWTRLLSVLIGATVYSFSIVLAVFLGGLGVGSLAASAIVRRNANPTLLLGLCQLLLVPAVAFAAYAINGVSPAIGADILSTVRVSTIALDVMRCVVAMLPATILWGASFPFAVEAIAGSESDRAKSTGRLLASNTVGAILGALSINTVVVAIWGIQAAQRFLIVALGASFLILCFHAMRKRVLSANALSEIFTTILRWPMISVTLLAAVVVYAGSQTIPPMNVGLYAYGRETERWTGSYEFLHSAEGRTAFVSVSEHDKNNYRSFHIGGKVVASTLPADMRLQRLLGQLPAVMHPNPKTVLIIGLGAGVTAGSFVPHEGIERIVIVEIEPVVAQAADKYFKNENYAVLSDPRTELIFDDARHYLATTNEAFDIITADPIHPWLKGSASLYTKEFLDLCRRHLNHDGLITQWVPLYETNDAAVKSQVGTFFEAFPNGAIWSSSLGDDPYDALTIAGTSPIKLDSKWLESQLEKQLPLKESLAEVGVNSPLDIYRGYAGDAKSLQTWLSAYEPNLDRNLRLEYLAGLSIDQRDPTQIFDNITEDLSYPADLFELPPAEEAELRTWFELQYRQVLSVE